MMYTMLFESRESGTTLSRLLSGPAPNFRGAGLWHAKLRNAVLVDADLTDADLMGADLRGADLRGVVSNSVWRCRRRPKL